MKIQLPNVTLTVTSSILIDEHIRAIEICRESIDFGEVVMVSHEKPNNLPDDVRFQEYKKIENIMDFNHLMFKDVGDFIQTSHALFIQNHAYVIHPYLWSNSWLQFDYIGSPWPIVKNSYIANDGTRARVGNGGFSLRSKKLLQLPKKMGWELRQEQGFYNEDGNICCYWRKEFLEQGIKYADIDTACQFSYENPVEENFRIIPFGFHKFRPDWEEIS